MSRTKKRIPPVVTLPPNKEANPEWWEDESNLIRLHPSYPQSLHPTRKKYEKKQQKKRPQ